MKTKRDAKGRAIQIPIKTKSEYDLAVEEFARQAKLPLGTKQTEGLQDLAEAILKWEEKSQRGNGHDKEH